MANEIEERCFIKEKRIGHIPTTLPALYDTDISNVEDGQALVYNAEKEKWVNGAGGSGGTVGNGMITLTQGGNNKGSFTVNQSGDTTIDLDAGGGDAFSTVKVGLTEVTASRSDTIEFEAGNEGITLSLDPNTKKLTITNSGGKGLSLGETAGTAYEGSKGKNLADRVGTLEGSVTSLGGDVAALEIGSVSKVSDAGEDNIAVLTADGDIDDSEVSISQVVLKSDTVGLLKNDGTVDTGTKATEAALNAEVERAQGAEANLNSGKANKVVPLLPGQQLSGHFAALLSDGDITDSGMSVSFIQGLQRQIADIYSRIAGFSVNISPNPVYANEQTSVTITGTCAAVPDSVVIERNGTTLPTPTISGTSFTCTDTVTPSSVDDIIYEVTVTISTEDNTIAVPLHVQATPVTITWSSNRATAYIGADNNSFPTATITGASSITYRSSNTSVATVNASTGEVALVGAGGCKIYAEYAGDATHTAASEYYGLEVNEDYVTSLTWTGHSLTPPSPNVGESALLVKGTVLANYASGKTPVNITNDPTTRYNAITGSISNVQTTTATYTPYQAGTDYIKVTYGNKEASFSVSVGAPVYAYIGAGTSVNAVAISANRTTNYGSGSVTYNVPVASGDSIYILMPAGVTYSAYMGGQPMALTPDNDYTKDGVTYIVKHSISFSSTSTKTITLNYT